MRPNQGMDPTAFGRGSFPSRWAAEMEPMGQRPHTSNFHSSLITTLSREQVAGLYGALGWQVRKCGWSEYEVSGPWAELIIESDSPILMHGSVADVLAHADELLSPMGKAGVAFTAECYGPAGELLRELRERAPRSRDGAGARSSVPGDAPSTRIRLPRA